MNKKIFKIGFFSVFLLFLMSIFFFPSKVNAQGQSFPFPVAVPSNFLQSIPAPVDCIGNAAYTCLVGGYRYPVLFPWTTQDFESTNSYKLGGYVLYMYSGGFAEMEDHNASVQGTVFLTMRQGISFPVLYLGEDSNGFTYHSIPFPSYSNRRIVGYYSIATGTWTTTKPANMFRIQFKPTETVSSQIWSSVPVFGNIPSSISFSMYGGEVHGGGNYLLVSPNISPLTIPSGGTYEPPAPPPPIGYIDEITGDWGTWDFFRDGINFLIRGLNGIIEGLNVMVTWLSDLFSNMVDWIYEKFKGIFIPEEDFLEDKILQIKNLFSAKVGFSDWDSVGNSFKNALSTTDSNPPSITGVLMGQNVTFLNFDLITPHIGIIRSFTNAILGLFLVVVILPRIYNKLIGKDN